MPNEIKQCQFCDEDIKLNAIKCKHCGEWLNKKETLSDSKNLKINFWIWFFIVQLFLSGLVSLLSAVYYYNQFNIFNLFYFFTIFLSFCSFYLVFLLINKSPKALNSALILLYSYLLYNIVYFYVSDWESKVLLPAIIIIIWIFYFSNSKKVELIYKKINKQEINQDSQCVDHVTVDYSRTIDEMIEFGKYDLVSDGITEKTFPLPTKFLGKKIITPVKLFQFKQVAGSDYVISEMEKMGCHPATLAELMALGESQPDLQRKFSIAALGSVWSSAHGIEYVALLRGDVHGRMLSLSQYDNYWQNNIRFLAVCK